MAESSADPFDASKAEAEAAIDTFRAAVKRLRGYARQIAAQATPAAAAAAAVVGAADDTHDDPHGETSSGLAAHAVHRQPSAPPRPPLAGAIDLANVDLALAERAARCVDETRGALSAAEDEVSLLRSVVDALKSGRVRRGTAVPHHVVAAREDYVEEAERRVRELHAAFSAVIDPAQTPALGQVLQAQEQQLLRGGRRRRGGPAGMGGGDDDDNNGDDDGDAEPDAAAERLMQHHRTRQAAMKADQDATLDRLHAGLSGATHRAVQIGDAITEDTLAMDEVEADVSRVESKLQAQMRRVDDLLEAMSGERKCGLVLCLVLVAFVLLLLLFTL